MAEIINRNRKSTRKTAKVNKTKKKVTPLNNKGEEIYTLELGTTASGIYTADIPPTYIDSVSLNNIEKEIEKALAILSSQIDWGTLDIDRYSPFISYFSPTGDNVPIKSKIIIQVTDDLPSSGVDLSDMRVLLNNGEVDFDITNELKITGNPYSFNIEWLPPNING
jgi:hypothetical protein